MIFIFEIFFAFIALLVMFASIITQIKLIKFKRGSHKQNALVKNIEQRKFWKNITVEFNYEKKTYQSQTVIFNKNLTNDSEIEILVNPLEMLKFNNPSFLQKKINLIGFLKKRFPTIYLIDPNTMIYHFGIIILCVIMMSFN